MNDTSRVHEPLPALTCRQCTRRKTKCDKAIPCSACLASGLSCETVQRRRLPRGRSGKQVSEGQSGLKRRLVHLETAIAQLQGERASLVRPEHEYSSWSSTQGSKSSYGYASSYRSFVAPEFWQTLSAAAEEIRVVLGGENFDDTEDTGQPLSSVGDRSHGPDALLFQSSIAPVMAPCDESWLHEQLLGTYRDRFDPLLKVLHWPTALQVVKEEGSSSGGRSTSEQRALRSAVLFGALCTIRPSEMRDKLELTRRYRVTAEACLVDAGLLTTTSLMVLQALVIYLAGLRTCQSNAQQWSLVALAVRIADSMHIRAAVKQHDLNAELRRRLWCCVGLLDLQSAFDRGSRPLLRADDVHHLPLDVNDVLFTRELARERDDRLHQTGTEFTEMTFSLTTGRAGIAQRRLAELQASAPDNAIDLESFQKTWWEKQLAIVIDFESYVTALTQTRENKAATTSLTSFTVAVARESLLAMRLQLQRPLNRNVLGLRPVGGDFDVLKAGVEVLESAAFKTSPEFAKWAWFAWVKWYALAIVLAELCSHPWNEKSVGAWQTAQASYEAYAKLVADAENGLLWKPIQRLMRKANSIAQVELHSTIVDTTAQPHEQNVNMMGNQQALAATSQEARSTETLQSSDPEQKSDLDFPAFDDAQAFDTDPMSWIHWDMFVDDIEQSSVHDTTFHWQP